MLTTVCSSSRVGCLGWTSGRSTGIDCGAGVVVAVHLFLPLTFPGTWVGCPGPALGRRSLYLLLLLSSPFCRLWCPLFGSSSWTLSASSSLPCLHRAARIGSCVCWCEFAATTAAPTLLSEM
eukprot:4418657-Amphidinium_carterae.1